MARWFVWGMLLFGSIAWAKNSLAMAPAEGLIIPGQGVGIIRLGEPVPRRLPLLLDRNLKSKGLVIQPFSSERATERITVYSPEFYVERSMLRPKRSIKAEILRYYGEGETRLVPGRLIVSFPAEGIEFEIDRRDGKELIRSITIFTPARREAPVEKYRLYREQLRQKR